MFSIDRIGPNRVKLALSGKLDSADMQLALEQLMTATQGIEQGRMLYTITDFAMPSLDAIAVKLTKLPALIALSRKFERIAVVADAAWIRAAGDLEGFLVPGMDVKGFTTTDEAQAWLDE